MRVLKFSASWCQPCKQLSKTLEAMEFPYEISEIDVDANQEAAIEYGIRNVPTMILVDENHNQIKRVSGAMTKTQIIKEFGLEQ
jgi:thioredoxin 1